MGLEAVCVGRLGEQVGEGKALLETDYVLFRGPFRSKIPLSEIKKVKAESGQLWLTSKGGVLGLELGAAAQKWADKILHPTQRIDKLGVKPGMQVILLGVRDKTFHKEVASRTPAIATKPHKGADIVFLATEKKADLRKLAAARRAINPNGSIWNIAGVCNEEGTVLGLMPHPERASEPSVGSTDGLLLFHSLLGSLVENGTVLGRS